MRSRVGSQFYASPELLLERAYSASIDLWGLGTSSSNASQATTLLRIVSTPSGTRHKRESITARGVHKFPDARALCLTLLCAEPLERPTPSEVLSHPWLRAAVSRDRRINLSLRYSGE